MSKTLQRTEVAYLEQITRRPNDNHTNTPNLTERSLPISLPKERRFQSFASRWGPGKVHRYFWDPLNKVWYVQCRGPYKDPHGTPHPDPEQPITCKKCNPQ